LRLTGLYADTTTLWFRQRADVDDHRPPHFHIVAPDFQVLVRISDLAVIAGEARESQIAEVLTWAKAHQEALALKWAELNERG
jgi:hypothetical protein